MPSAPRALAAAIVVVVGLVLAGCGHGGSSAPQSTEGTPAQITAAALSYVNTFRIQCGEAPLTDAPALDNAAGGHAGWMVLQEIGLTHYETTDGTAGGPPATSNPLYRGVTPAARVQANNGGVDLLVGTTYQESLTTFAGPNAITEQWYSIYHRLPLMRAATAYFGFGDWDAALDLFPGTLPVGHGFSTTLVATDPSLTTVIASSWPPTGLAAIPPIWNPATETPNAFDPGNGGQNPPTPATGLLGPPLHIILPTSQDWATVSVLLASPGTASVPLYLLVGGSTVPSLTGSDPATLAFTDAQLQPGELFIVPQAPLQSYTTYTASLTATTQGTTPDTVTLGVSAPWTFTTGQ